MANLGTLWFGADIDLTNLKQKIQSGNADILNSLKISYDPSSYAAMVNKLRASLSQEVFEIRVNANAQKTKETVNQTLNSLASTGQINPVAPAALGSVNKLKLDVIEAGESVRRTSMYVKDLERQLAAVVRTSGAFSPEAMKLRQQIAQAKLSLIEERDVQGQLNYQKKLAALAQSQLNQQKREGAAAAKELNSNSIRLNTTLANGIHVSTQLGSALSSLFAVDAARQFLENVIEIGGQLEMQRISIGAILDDLSHANELFGQIKNLAIKSPFGVVELDQYSKQLSAYGFQYNELYDMTKRLADISAGAGQDIGRLTLALGHVRSATYLTGITLRQFSMNNIPMLRMLADYYSELEHRAVSTAEVTKRISQKQVSYEDVIEQIYRMTDAGGKFYNMQEKVSTSLKAKFKNLKDSFDIMYGEVAESKIGDALKETATILTTFARQWQRFVSMLGAAATVFGSVKLAQFAFNQGLIVSNGLVKANAIATSQYTMAQLRSLATLKATNIQYLANAYGLTGMEKGLLRLKLVLLGAKNAFAGFVAILRSAMPYLATFAAISIAVDIFDEIEEKTRAESQLLANITEKSTEGYRNMLEMRKKFAVGASIGMDNESLSMAIDDMVEKLKDYSLTANSTFNNAFAVDEEGKSIHSLAEQYEILAKAVDDTTNAYKELNEIKPLIADALSKGEDYSGTILGEDVNRIITRAGDKMFGWFTDWAIGKEFRAASMNFKESMQFYVEAMNQSSVAENKFLQSRMDVISKLEKMGYKEVLEMDNDALLTFLTEMKYTAPSSFKKFADSLEGDAKKSLEKMLDSWDRLGVASLNAESRMADMGQTLYDALKVTYNGKDVEEWADGWEETVLAAANEATKGIQGFADLSKEAQNEIYNAFLKPFKITIDTNEAQERVNNLLVDLQNLVGRDWVVKIGVKGESSIEDSEAAIKAYKKAVGDIEDTQARLNKLQEEGKRGSEAYNQTLKDNLEAQKAKNAAMELGAEYGVDFAKVDEELAKKNKKNDSKNSKDTQLERAKTYFDEIKSFLDEYKKYVEVYGKDKSIDLLEKMFPTTKGRGQEIVKNFKNVLLKIKNSLPMDSEARKKFGVSIDKYIADFDLNEAKKVIDAALKDMQDYIASQSDKYNLYKALFEKTGNKKFAEAAFADGRVWDDVARQFEDSLKEITGGDIFDYEGYAGAAEEYYKGNKEAFELWKKIVEITKKNYNDALTKGADALAKQMTIEEKIVAAEERIAELREKRNNESNGEVQKSLDLQIGAASKELDKLNYEKFQQSIEYLEFFGATLALTDSEVQKIGMDIKTMLLKELSNGTITAHDYAKTIKDVNERMEESSKTVRGGFAAFLQGGQKGVVDMRNNIVAKWAIEVERAQKDIQEAQRKGDTKALFAAIQRGTAAEKELEAASKQLGISVKQLQMLSKLSYALSVYQGLLEGFQKVAQNLSEMFDALGDDKLANTFEDLSDGINAFSSALKPINNLVQNAMNGNVTGIVSSAISAPVEMFTAPITAFAKLHDKQMEREIQASKQRVKEMENLTKNLETALGRSLSGVYGIKASESMLKELEEKIFSWQWVEDKNKPIYGKYNQVKGYKMTKQYQRKDYMLPETEEALNRAKETKTYYDAQYASLRAQQDEIRHQMDMEQGKKKSNAQAIEDYKQQIAEIEDEIKNFSLDMAKALYDIDVKSWADELGDALFEAWQKGESGAEAFKKKVGEIIAETTKNIVSQKIIGKALEKVEQYIADSMVASSGKLDPVAFAKGLSEKLNMAFAEIDSTLAPALDATEAAISKYGYSMKEAGESGVSAGIKSITEETADLLASYVNAIRADLSLVREVQITHIPIISEACMRGNILAEQQVQEQRQIAANTLRNAEAAELIYEILHNNVLGANKFAVA